MVHPLFYYEYLTKGLLGDLFCSLYFIPVASRSRLDFEPNRQLALAFRLLTHNVESNTAKDHKLFGKKTRLHFELISTERYIYTQFINQENYELSSRGVTVAEGAHHKMAAHAYKILYFLSQLGIVIDISEVNKDINIVNGYLS